MVVFALSRACRIVNRSARTFVWTGALVGGLVLVPGQAGDVALGDRVNVVLHWLAPDTESVFVVQHYPANALYDNFVNESEFDASFVSALQSFPLLRLYDFFSEQRHRCLAFQTLRAAVYAAKHFERVNGSRDTSVDTLILVFESDETHRLAWDVQPLIEQAPRKLDICGHQVGVYSDKRGRFPELFFCQPDPDVLLFSSSETELRTTLAQRGSPPAKTFFEDWPLRGAMEKDAQIWGLRQYRTEDAESDLTNRRNPGYEVLESAESDPDAVGVAIWYDGKTEQARFLFMSKSFDGFRHIENEWRLMKFVGLGSVIHERSREFVDLSVAIDDDVEAIYDLLLYTCWLLGSTWVY